jgi:hypothetical protein
MFTDTAVVAADKSPPTVGMSALVGMPTFLVTRPCGGNRVHEVIWIIHTS